MKIHHIGYLVKDIEMAIEAFALLGYSVEQPTVYDSLRGGDICFLKMDETVVELVAPKENCQLYRSLVKRIGNAPYHMCYVADNFVHDIEWLQKNGWVMIQSPQEAVAIDKGRRVAFFYHNSIGMIEVVE